VIDGLGHRRKMLSRSENYAACPHLFYADRPSISVAQAAKKECFSTVEAIHQTLKWSDPARL